MSVREAFSAAHLFPIFLLLSFLSLLSSPLPPPLFFPLLSRTGFAFVQFKKPEDAKKALQQVNGLEIAGRPIKVGLVNESQQGGGVGDLDDGTYVVWLVFFFVQGGR